MVTTFNEILIKEGITKAEISERNGLNPTTIHYLCKDPNYHKKRKAVTKYKALLAINEMGGSNKEYELNEVFPE
ncbi:hypothetical protein [Flagellimonas flava]|uniref:hypothetical protein n=1 Tax=Flagellimonas flava TaxID=570519 RepID=UPI003D65AC92